ncbi:MAG: gliding motility-associated C-terminal domain-containing protein [Bacteroidota bacterium]
MSVTVQGGTVTTSCDDIFSGPDERFRVSVDGGSNEVYDPAGTDGCFTAAPFAQFTQDYTDACNLPLSVNVCFGAFENDGFPFTCQVNPDCLEEVCQDILLPAVGESRNDTIRITTGASTGELYLTLTMEPDPQDFNLLCGAVDLGLLDFGVTLGDSTTGIYNNNCADNLNEIQPTDIFVNLFNNHGVWFEYVTGDTPAPLHVVEVISDPDNTGDPISAEVMVFRADSCTGELSRYPLFIQSFDGEDAQLDLLCPTPNTRYYILVDGRGNEDEQQGTFAITIYDPGFPAGADLKCDADDLGIVPENGSVTMPNPVGNFCATFAGDPFVRNFISRNSIWFTFRAPSSGHIQVDATSNPLDPIDIELALYRSNQDTCDSFLTHLYSGRDASSFDESFTFSCLDPGRQYWILADGAGLESIGFLDLRITDLGDIRPVTTQTDTICSGDVFTVGGIFAHDTTGVYTDTLKIGSTNCDSIVITDLLVLPPLELSVTQTRPAIGSAGTDGVAQAIFSGGFGIYELSWCGGSATPVAPGDTVVFDQLVAGATCCVTLTDGFGCTKDTCFEVDFVPPFEPFSSTNEVLCHGDSTGSITFGITGGRAPYFYSWRNDDFSLAGTGIFLTDGEQIVIPNLPAAEYTINILDEFFDSTFVLTVTEPEELIVSIDNFVPISCFQACDATFDFSATGGVGAYTFTTQTPPAGMGCPGFYVVQVTDENGCTDTANITIIEPEEFIVSTASVQQVTCFAGEDGAISLTSNGNPQTYQWSNGMMTADINGLPAGVYTVTVTNDDGCPDTISVTVTQPAAPLQIDIAEINPITCAVDADGTLRANVIGGEGEITFAWSDTQTTGLATDLGPGLYSVSVTDQRGCSAVATYELTAPPVLTASISERDLRCPDPEDAGEISVPEVSGGVGPYLYGLNDQSFSPDTLFTGLLAGPYTVVVEDALGCQLRIPAAVNPPPVLRADLGPDQQILLGDSLLLDLQANSTDIVYNWSFNADLQSSQVYVRPASTTRISVTITDTLFECTTTADLSIMVDARPRVYVPTAFSPNGDGVNDIFFPFGGTDVVEINDFRIFGRFGNLVYEAPGALSPNSPGFGWNGLINGEPAQIGVYVYTSSVRFFDGREEIVKGEVTLVR